MSRLADMRFTRQIILLYNVVAILPVIFYMLFWGIITLSLLNAFVFFFAFLIFILVFAIFSAVRLKIRILRDTRDHRLKPVKHLYKEATRVNLYGYLIFYPMMFMTTYASGSAIAGLVLLGACILAIPLLVKVLKLRKEYKDLKAIMAIGKVRCRKCRVSLFYYPQTRQWVCYKCGVRF